MVDLIDKSITKRDFNCRRESAESAKRFHGRILPESAEEISKIRRLKCASMSTCKKLCFKSKMFHQFESQI